MIKLKCSSLLFPPIMQHLQACTVNNNNVRTINIAAFGCCTGLFHHFSIIFYFSINFLNATPFKVQVTYCLSALIFLLQSNSQLINLIYVWESINQRSKYDYLTF